MIAPTMHHIISEHVRRSVGRLMRRRERYIRAFVAATGLDPRECEIVETDDLLGAGRHVRVRELPEYKARALEAEAELATLRAELAGVDMVLRAFPDDMARDDLPIGDRIRALVERREASEHDSEESAARLRDELAREREARERASNELENLRGIWETSCEHVVDALGLLGVDTSPAGWVGDTWTLMTQCERVAARLREVEEAAAAYLVAPLCPSDNWESGEGCSPDTGAPCRRCEAECSLGALLGPERLAAARGAR